MSTTRSKNTQEQSNKHKDQPSPLRTHTRTLYCTKTSQSSTRSSLPHHSQTLLQLHPMHKDLKQGAQIPSTGQRIITPGKKKKKTKAALESPYRQGNLLQGANTKKAHMVHNLRVVLGQNHRHGVRKARELDGVRVLSVLLVTQDHARSLVLLFIQ